ncbi:MAG: phosphoribosyl-AMP cyclohydrolase, partial [Rhodobiaceae bacterium]|nr:phosphoribosyl-AMP cyclohydrolase [Rhodobiaceae bacterium]
MSQNYENNFKQRLSVEEVEEGLSLSPKFDENGLIPCITT